jgi:hypothetical protein
MMKFDAHQPICYLSPRLKGQILSCYFLTVGIGAAPNADMARPAAMRVAPDSVRVLFLLFLLSLPLKILKHSFKKKKDFKT